MSLSLYAIGGLGLAVVLVGGYAALENSWRKNYQLQVAVEQEANKQNQRTINLLKTSTETANRLAMELIEENNLVLKQKEEDDAAVTELAGSDEEVRKFLATPVPAKLRCLWERKKCANGTASPNP